MLNCRQRAVCLLYTSLGPQTYGPYQNKKNKEKAKRAIDKAALVIARDEASMQYVKYFTDKEVYTTTDLAFILPYKSGGLNRSTTVCLLYTSKYAEAIEKLAEDKNLRKKYGEAGRMRVMNNFLSTQYSENIRNLVKEMITE